jgi:hypothetical protein
MIKLFKKYFWTMLIVIAALGLAGSAAYFSISGLSKLFAGSALQVIIMASFIEFAKIATTAALHKFWKDISWLLKLPLTIMVIVIMGITSSGIYGFLADAYSTTSVQLEKIEGQIALIEKQQEQKKVQITGIEEIKTTKTDRVTSLIDLRVQQESRLDSLYNKGAYSTAKKTQALIDQSTLEIQSLQVELDTIANKINRINSEIGELDIQVLDLQNTDVATEIGPLKYMSKVLDKPMENIINWFIMAIMLAFDPLAILLVILANVLYDKANRSKAPPQKELEPIEELEESPEVVEPEDDYQEDDYQKVVDAVNNTDPETHDYSYDFIPQEKSEEVVEYIEGEGGKFEKSEDTKESIASIIKGIDPNPLYLQLLDIFYLNGQRKVGDIIPPYEVFLKDIRNKGIDCPEKVVKNFLTISNLFGIVNMIDKNNVTITKDYQASKQIISLVSK